MLKFLLLFLVFINTGLFADDSTKQINNVDCIILEDENSIICKYTHKRMSYEKNVVFNWIEPDGKISRTRDLTIPAGHGSVYDYRYIKGRTKGIWTLQVLDDKDEYKTNFTIK